MTITMTNQKTDALRDDLYRIYEDTREARLMKADVNGVQRPYVPSRFRQALDMAPQNGGYLAYVERLLLEMGPAQGMTFRLVAEGLEHLTVEAQVVDKSKPYHDLFSPPAVAVARDRLRAARSLARADRRERSLRGALPPVDRLG